MIRGLLKLVAIALIVIAIGVFFLGWRVTRDGGVTAPAVGETVGTAGESAADKGREVGAAIGQRTGQAADATQRALADGTLTAKIKAKMGLDDSVKALNLDVDTRGGIVTLTGVVHSEAERQRALQLARETSGVTQVIDRMTVR